ncbi:ogr/Delta-like zinc finger family protein [Pseudomonas asplenii]|uniref:ogr/Delta-like zinc finger family protein n=1 Tax=Pseudomonas asplenii TaxID=53407 RepID=UPI00235DEC89|nr:ogr/Delta-like zinc finger family protein [Pseudomonas asplenii]
MRIYCTSCGNKGRITSREEVSPVFTKLYCQCQDAKCGHTWVNNLTFSHTLSPSAQAFDLMILDRLKGMPRAKQRELFDQLGAA